MTFREQVRTDNPTDNHPRRIDGMPADTDEPPDQQERRGQQAGDLDAQREALANQSPAVSERGRIEIITWTTHKVPIKPCPET